MTERYTDMPASVLPPTRRKRRWPRILGYTLAVPLWLLFVPAVAAQVGEPPRSAAYVVGTLIGTAGTTLLVAAAIRWVYAKLSGRRVMSPWLFAIAGVFALVSYASGTAREEARVNREAVERGIASSTADVTRVDRCITRTLEEADALAPGQLPALPGGVRSFSTRVCARLERDGTLTAGGDTRSDRAFQVATCAEAMLVDFESIPRRQRGFSYEDFVLLGETYCREAIDRGFDNGNTSPGEMLALQQRVVDDLIASRKITRIR